MHRAKKRVGQGVLLLAAAGMMVYGVGRGEAAMVLSKAITVCLECIGLG